jgi:hypothetical protein
MHQEALLEEIDNYESSLSSGYAPIVIRADAKHYKELESFLAAHEDEFGALTPTPHISPYIMIESTKEQAKRLVNAYYGNGVGYKTLRNYSKKISVIPEEITSVF